MLLQKHYLWFIRYCCLLCYLFLFAIVPMCIRAKWSKAALIHKRVTEVLLCDCLWMSECVRECFCPCAVLLLMNIWCGDGLEILCVGQSWLSKVYILRGKIELPLLKKIWYSRSNIWDAGCVHSRPHSFCGIWLDYFWTFLQWCNKQSYHFNLFHEFPGLLTATYWNFVLDLLHLPDLVLSHSIRNVHLHC